MYVSGQGQFRVRVVSVQGQGYVSGQVGGRIRLGQQGCEAELETGVGYRDGYGSPGVNYSN